MGKLKLSLVVIFYFLCTDFTYAHNQYVCVGFYTTHFGDMDNGDDVRTNLKGTLVNFHIFEAPNVYKKMQVYESGGECVTGTFLSFRDLDNHKRLIAEKHNEGGKMDKFKRYRLYVGLGAPYVVNLGFRYRLSKSWFLEVESPIIPVPLAFNFGTSTTEYVKPPSFIFLDLEAKVVIGYDLLSFTRFASLGFFSPPYSIGIGLAGGFDVETRVGFLLYMKFYGIYQSGYGAVFIQMGMGWNF
jgi:hypothetical protein